MVCCSFVLGCGGVGVVLWCWYWCGVCLVLVYLGGLCSWFLVLVFGLSSLVTYSSAFCLVLWSFGSLVRVRFLGEVLWLGC